MQTLEGFLALEAMKRWGAWRRAGMDGELVGLDLTEALASLPADANREFARALLIKGEAGFMAGYFERKAREKQGTK